MCGNSSKIFLLIFVLAFMAAMGGCGGGPSMVARSNFVEFTPDQKEEIASQSSNEYRIQDGDVLKVAFSYQKELNQSNVMVLSDGSIGLAGVDRVEVSGLTLTEADSVITTAYSFEYLDPDLSIIMEKTQGRQVYVLGEVAKPGLHKLPAGGLDVIGAISVAGGFGEDAAKAGTVLVRVTNEGYLVQEIDLDGWASVSHASLALVQVQNYDVIYVPRSRIGDFAYFSKTVLTGLVQITRIATDIKFLSGGGAIRF